MHSAMHAYYGTLYVKNIHFSRRIKKRSKQILEFVSKWKLLPPMCGSILYNLAQVSIRIATHVIAL